MGCQCASRHLMVGESYCHDYFQSDLDLNFLRAPKAQCETSMIAGTYTKKIKSKV